MAKKKPPTPENEPTQTTEQGFEIPVPKRKDVLDAMRKIAKPVKPDGGPPPNE